MRAMITLCVCFCVVMCQDLNDMSQMPKYDSRYDYLDVDDIFTNKRLVRIYVDCLTSSVRCTPEGKALKRLLPEALRTKCVRCTERQKRTAVKIIRRLKYEYPDEWAKVSTRWDPTGDFTRYFEEFLAKEQFNSIPGSGVVLPLSTVTQQPPPPPAPVPAPAPAPAPSTNPPPTAAVLPVSTSPRPIILNRFGGDGELMIGSPSSAAGTTRPTTPPGVKISTMRPFMQTRPTPAASSGSASNAIPTRFPLRPTTDLPLPYSTAITLIDQIGYKIIRTTELVTDLLRNTVRAVVG
uniref:Putative chemosensory protein 3 n=1 Tax=Ectropis obliqua TaxID=248899 RepID=A0A1W5LAT1_ECTOB|nr:putative chemosensory protein 3 [Ectropis obliqua]